MGAFDIPKSLIEAVSSVAAKKKPLETLTEQNTKVLREKTDPVDPKQAKGKFKDRKDKDIDNDGEVDDSDEYLHNRRNAISKNKSKNKKDKNGAGPKDTLDMEPNAGDDSPARMSEAKNYEYDEGEGVVKISKKNYAKVHKDYKGSDKSKPSMLVLTKRGTSLVPVKFTDMKEGVELEEAEDKLSNLLFKKYTPAEWENKQKERARKLTNKRYMKPGKPRHSSDWKLYKHFQEEDKASELEEADIYHKHMLKALGKSRLPKNHAYTSEVNKQTGDFLVRDGGGRVVGRLKKGEHSLGEKTVDEMRTNSSEASAKGDGYLHKKKLPDGNHFVVGYNPNYRGQKGVDKALMKVVDSNNKTVKHMGTHPSIEGAKKFGETSLHKYYPGAKNEEVVVESYKVGDEVIPSTGPHKGQKHKVIHVHKDGERFNIQPVGLNPKAIKYRLGAATAKKSELSKAT